MLYKYSAVCCITKQDFFFSIFFWIQFLWRKAKLSVNLGNRILWFRSQIITAGSSTVRFDYVMLLSIEILYQLIMSIDKYIKTDICFFYRSRLFCIIRNNHIWSHRFLWLNCKAHCVICSIFARYNCRKCTIFLSTLPVNFLRLSFCTRLCADRSCKR